MSIVQLALAAPAHNNQQLFSDHYLNDALPQRADWRGLAGEAAPVMAEIAAIFSAYTPSAIEAQTEHDLVRPVLQALGHTFEVQPSLATPDGTKTPDYVFYRDQASLDANKNTMLTDELLRSRAFGVGDAKHWDRKLDVTLRGASGDPFNNKNPSYQIAFYIQHSAVEWGILTNGRLWRLYHRDTAHKLDRYYEVDLPALLASGDTQRFLYFHAFFRRAAFEPGALGVSELLRASIDYALGVSETLKAQVFEAVRHLAQGFLDYAPNGLERDEQTLKAIYDNSLILLYRLLFVLYAEARELLPVRESAIYRQSYSLRSITHEIAGNLRAGRVLLPTSAILWPRLKALCQIIDTGSPELRVATFNGGLFDPARHPFLEQRTVGDAHLQQAIDTLARVDGQFVDYRDLAEHHLGSIYEGLLEYQLAAIEPESGWTVAIVNDRGERKTSGSYYTPYFIVQYIVEQTVGPMLREAIAGKQSDAEKIAAVLNTNVLDPAMGSGYFLVEATEYIARFLVDQALTPTTDAQDEADLVYWKRRVVQSCIYGVDLNPLAVDLAKLSLWLSTVARDQPLSFLDHHLRAGNSLVGARVSDLQSQVSKPANKGQSRKRQRQAIEAGQLSLLTDDTFRRNMSIAVDSMWLIEGTAGTTVGEVKEQERVYAELRETLTRRYSKLANLVTATRFGMEIDQSLWQPLADYAVGRTITAPQQLIDWLEDAERLARRERFFHWDLEFPEIFFDRLGEPLGELAGFDVVIGNPPYVRQERLASIKPYLRQYAAFQSTADLYLYFYEQGIGLLQDAGRLGYITSGTFTRGNFATAFRKALPDIARIETVIDFGENQPFKGAEMVRPSIVIMTKGEQAEPFQSLFIAGEIPTSLQQALDEDGVVCAPAVLHEPEWIFQAATLSALSGKILGTGCPLDEVVKGQIFRGLITGLNEAFTLNQAGRDRLVAEDAMSAEVIKPLVTGQDLRPWYQEDEGRWLIVFPCGWTQATFGTGLSEEEAWNAVSARYPAVTSHLLPFAQAARKRQDKGDYWWELRACDYYWAFERPKVMWPDISKLPRFSWDDAGTYINNTGYFIPDPAPWLLGVLQSRALWFAVSQISQPLRLRGGLWQYRLFSQFMTRLPIPEVSSADEEYLGGLVAKITEAARARYELHRAVRRRILADLGTPDKRLNQKLTRWWELDFATLRAEVRKVFKREIPVKERDEWDDWLTSQTATHGQLTAAIVALETELNARVYELFDLTAVEIAAIEETTKFEYGEV